MKYELTGWQASRKYNEGRVHWIGAPILMAILRDNNLFGIKPAYGGCKCITEKEPTRESVQTAIDRFLSLPFYRRWLYHYQAVQWFNSLRKGKV